MSAETKSHQSRRIVWRVFCPSCLTATDDVMHHGTADLVQQFKCSRCQRRFSVRTGVGSAGNGECHSTPVFIKAPEIVTDTHPLDIP